MKQAGEIDAREVWLAGLGRAGLQADLYTEQHRAVAFGGMGACFSIGFLLGTLIARIVPLHYVFPAAVAVNVVALVYLKLFLPETAPKVAVVSHKGETPLPASSLSSSTASASSRPRAPPAGPTLLRSKSSVREAIDSLSSK
eukprot:jgi/Mesen1/9813/ME000007S09868